MGSLTIDKTNSLKGILAFCILMHHLQQMSGFLAGSPLLHLFSALGYLATGCFFFLSGYGLQKQYQIKGHSYMKRFWTQKILPFYANYLFLVLIYVMFEFTLGENISVKRIILSLLCMGDVVGNGWYLQTTLVLYIIFILHFLGPKTIIKS